MPQAFSLKQTYLCKFQTSLVYDNLQANQTMCQKNEQMGLEDESVVNSKGHSAPSNHATTPNNHL